MVQPEFLPVSQAECERLGWWPLDVVIVTGDAYVDHPAFGAALIGRSLVARGFRVGIIAQPDWHGDKDFLALGRPRLFFGVTAGNMDSMVNHYTAQRKIRTDDAFSPGGKAGRRPDRATIIYTQHLRRLFKGVPVVIGGIEASMRRIPHYDYWTDTVRNSILLDSKADMLVYGMAEKTIAAVAQYLRMVEGSGVRVQGGKEECANQCAAVDVRVPGTVVAVKEPEGDAPLILPSWEESKTKDGFWKMSKMFHDNFRTSTLFQPFAGRFLKHNPPASAMTTEELDAVYALPFARAPHPRYRGAEIPAFTQIKESVTAHRGCFGGCAFCALGYHQGRTIQSRSLESVKNEIGRMVRMPGFGGVVSDVGGPSANMYGMRCRRRQCEGENVGKCEGEAVETHPSVPPKGQYGGQAPSREGMEEGKCVSATVRPCVGPCESVDVRVSAADQAQPPSLPASQPLPHLCTRDSCLFPSICPHLDTSHAAVRRLLKECRGIQGVKHVHVSSGVRFDLALRDEGYIDDLARYHTGGRLKVAPEHTCADVLRRMHKPGIGVFEKFCDVFERNSMQAGRRQEIVPYLMVGHPGTTLHDAMALHEYLKRHDIRVEQIQEFTPTPMTPSTCMYYTGKDFDTGKPIHVPKGREVRLQKALAQWFMPENRKLVEEARRIADR